MQGVSFLGMHSYRDFGLFLQPDKVIGSPPIKEEEMELPGGDGRLDMTENHTEVKFDNVKHKFNFAIAAPQDERLASFMALKNAIHGKRGRIILDGDPSYFYVGRISVSSMTNNSELAHLSIECNCEPYKYKIEKTVVTKAVNGTETITLTNGRKRAVPEVTIETAGSLRLVYNDNFIWDLGSGSYTLPELELMEGANTVTVTGTGTVSFVWQEGDL